MLSTVTGLLVFLAYSTTPAVARALGGGDRRGAVHAGIDGMWLALVLGVVLALVGWPLAGPLVDLFGASAEVSAAATAYLTISLVGLPGILVVTASTGLLRGLQDTKTPLVVATIGFVANGLLNAVLIYGAGWGVEGSAAGTVIVQWAMAVVYVRIAVRAARSSGAPLRPAPRASPVHCGRGPGCSCGPRRCGSRCSRPSGPLPGWGPPGWRRRRSG